MTPGAVAKERGKRYNDRGEAGGQVRHGGVSWRKLRQPTASFASPPCAPTSPARNGQSRAKNSVIWLAATPSVIDWIASAPN